MKSLSILAAAVLAATLGGCGESKAPADAKKTESSAEARAEGTEGAAEEAKSDAAKDEKEVAAKDSADDDDDE